MTQANQRQLVDQLNDRAQGKVCLKCDHSAWVAQIDGMPVLRCNCYPDGPQLVEAPSHEQKGLARQFNENASSTNQGVQAVSATDLQKLYPKANEREIWIFMRLCVALEANPFLGEAHLVKYADNAPAAFVPGYQIYLKRAARNLSVFDGFSSGVIIEREDGTLEHREGSMVGSKEALAGGWCKVYRKDQRVPVSVTVSLDDFDKHQSQWKERPGYMIEKVAISHGFRRAFPDEAQAIEAVEQSVTSAAPKQLTDADKRDLWPTASAPGAQGRVS